MLAGGENGFHILIGQFPARVGFKQNFMGHGLPLVLGQIIGRIRGFIAPAQSFEPRQQRPRRHVGELRGRDDLERSIDAVSFFHGKVFEKFIKTSEFLAVGNLHR